MKKEYQRLVLLLSFIFSTLLHAQVPVINNYPQWSLRTLPSTLLDADAGIMLGVNYRWSDRFSASIEPTYIFFSPFDISEIGKIFTSGIKIRADFRFHLKREIMGMEGYLAPEFHYKNTQTKRLEQFGIGCQNGSCAYFQSAYYKELKREIGGIIKMGAFAPISRNGRWLLEFYSGLGVKHMKFRVTDIPTGGSFQFPPDRLFPEFLFAGDDQNSFYHPMLPGGIKLVLMLK